MDVEWFGYAGAVLLTSMSIPQIARIVRDHSAAGVSLTTWLIFALSGISWLAYGLILQAPAVIVGNITFVGTTLPVVMLLLRRQRRWQVLPAVAAPLAAAVVLVAGLRQVPAVIPSSLGVLCGTLTTVPQLFVSLRRRRNREISEVSLATLGLLATGQLLWLSYGLARPDVPIIVTNVIAVAVTFTLIIVEAGARLGRSSTESTQVADSDPRH
ncbi:MAG: PQ-loop domain-containing transporter [Candidatus Nanopelagicales bacterium]